MLCVVRTSYLHEKKLFSSGDSHDLKWIYQHELNLFIDFYDLQDGNLPNGESFIRQFLYGQKFFQAEFGRKCNVVSAILSCHVYLFCMFYLSPFVVKGAGNVK